MFDEYEPSDGNIGARRKLVKGGTPKFSMQCDDNKTNY